MLLNEVYMNDTDEIVNAKIPKEESINVDHKQDENLRIDNKECFFSESFYRTTVFDNKDFYKIVKACERMIRQSEEYKTFIFKINEILEETSCSVLGNISSGEDAVTIEIDHYPFTLFDICASVINKYIAEEKKFNSFMIAKEVMRLHFDMKVGVVPLSLTMHQLRHSGKIFINLKQVTGKYLDFAKEYGEHIDPETMTKFIKLLEMSRDNAPLSSDPEFLSINHQGFYSAELPPPSLNLEDRT